MARLTRWLSRSPSRTSARPPQLRHGLQVEALESREVPTVFSNSSAITIVDGGSSNPFPSQINVTGMGNSVSSLSVNLTGYSEQFGVDVDVLLVGPQGQKILLMSDVSGNYSNVNLTFADGSPVMGFNSPSGTYRPTNNDNSEDFTTYGGPAGPYGSALSDFTGTNPNGAWSLYILDDINDGGINGTFSGGWSLDITTAVPQVSSITRVGAPTTNAGSVQYTVTFNQSVTGVDTSDFALTTTGSVSGASVTGVSGSGTTYTVTVNTGSGDGTIRLDLADDDSITNATSDPLGGSGNGNGNFTAGQVYTIDKTAPTIASVGVPTNATYLAGQHLDFTVNFTEVMTVTGTPQLSLTIGASTVYANYQSGTGSTALVFRYTVQSGDLDANGIAVGTLTLNGGTIRDAVTNDAVLTLNSVGSTSGVLVDAVAPLITGVSGPANTTYVVGQNLDFTVNFDEIVTVNTGGGTPRIALTIGSTPVYATYQSGTGTTALLFRYTVQAGDLDTNGIASTSPIDLNGGTIRDAATNNAVLTFTPPNTSSVLVDGVAPTITTVSGPANGSYRAGQHLDFTVTFDEAVTVNTGGGTPRIAVNIGASTVYADYQSGTGTTSLTFRYTVQAGDTDVDGIAATSPIDLNGGTIRDAATNAAALGFTPPNTVGVLVDTTAPTVVSVVRVGGTPTNTGTVQFIVTYSEPVSNVFSNDFGLLTTGSVTGASVSGVSGSGTTYTVSVNTGTGDGTIGLDVLAGGADDAAGNTNTAFSSGEVYTIDKTAPAGPVVTSPMAVTALNAATFMITGTAEANALVQVYTDTNNNGVIDGGDTLVGSQQLTSGATAFAITVSLSQDSVNNFLVMATDAAGNTSALTDVPTITEDSSLPGLVSVTPPSNGVYKAGLTLDWTVTFSEPVFVTGTPRIALTVGSATVYADYVSGSGTDTLVFRYTVQAGDTDGDGVEAAGSIDLNGGTIRDDAANDSGLSLPTAGSSAVIVDTTAPTATFTSNTPAATNATLISVTLTFNEDVTGFTAVNLGATNGTVGNFVMVNARTYTFDLTPAGDGEVRVDVVGFSTVVDAAGNPSELPGTFSRTFDGTRPTATVTLASGQQSTVGRGPVRFTVTFSESVSGFDASDLVIGGTATPGSVSVSGGGTTYEVTLDGFTRSGTVTVAVADAAATDAVGNTSAAAVAATVRLAGEPSTIVTAVPNAGTNGTVIRVTDPTTGQVSSITPYPTFPGAVSVISADVNGDGVADIVTGAGMGGGSHVKVFDGTTGTVLREFFAFDLGFKGGVDVSTGDINGDGVADIIVAAGAGGGPHVKAFNGATGTEILSFFAYNPVFAGGVHVAVGDVDGDRLAEIVTAPGLGGGPHVRVFSGTGALETEFMAYDPVFRGGVSVAVGDLDGDGVSEIITGAGPGGGPHVKAFDARSNAVVRDFFAYDPAFVGGVNVATADVNDDGLADIVTGAGFGGGPHVKVFNGLSLAIETEYMGEDVSFIGGVNVG
jgi:hypothetical protein